jgi:hypothetical protein
LASTPITRTPVGIRRGDLLETAGILSGDRATDAEERDHMHTCRRVELDRAAVEGLQRKHVCHRDRDRISHRHFGGERPTGEPRQRDDRKQQARAESSPG